MAEIDRLKEIVEKLRSEEGLFSFDDVAKVVSDKMVRRHPHVFNGVVYESEDAQHKAWEEIKKAEKSGKKDNADSLPAAFEESIQLIIKAKERKGFK